MGPAGSAVVRTRPFDEGKSACDTAAVSEGDVSVGSVGSLGTESRRSVGTAFQRFLGLRWKAVNDVNDGVAGAIAVEMDIAEGLRGPAGFLEGGVVSTLVDVAGASAIATAAGVAMVATEHISLSFLAPGRVGPVRATGVPLRIGKQAGVAEVKVVDTGKDNRLMAIALVTVRVLSSSGSSNSA